MEEAADEPARPSLVGHRFPELVVASVFNALASPASCGRRTAPARPARYVQRMLGLIGGFYQFHAHHGPERVAAPAVIPARLDADGAANGNALVDFALRLPTETSLEVIPAKAGLATRSGT
jgi:hypothetical protein